MTLIKKKFEKRGAFLCIALVAVCCLMVASVAANPDVTNVNLDINPAIVPGYNNYSVCFHINMGLTTSSGIFITFDESTLVDENLEEECITVSYNGTSAHPEIREIIHNPDQEYEQYHFPDGTTTVKMSVPFNIPFNNDVCVNFTCGIYNDCPCGPHNVWVNTDLEKVPVISNPVDMNVTITADVIGGNGKIYSPKGAIAPPEFIDLWSCGDSPCYSIVPATGGNITDVWVDGESVLDDLTWYPNGSAQYCFAPEFAPLTCSHTLTAEFEGEPSGSISGYKLDTEMNGLPDWEMTLSDETGKIDETETDDDGFYIFTGLPFGTYTVTEELEEGYVNITPLSQEVVIDEEEPDVEDVNFINHQISGNISGYKLDDEGNPLSGWEINLYDEMGLIAMYTTGSDGRYHFTNLAPGEYEVDETLKPGWILIDPVEEYYEVEITETNTTYSNLNFTNKQLFGVISGYKLDREGNGLPDWEMTLSNETTEIDSTETDDEGFYLFTGLLFGTYAVTEELQEGYVNITPLSQGGLVIDAENQTIENVNFVNEQLKGSISGYKIDNTTGLGIPDWEMELYVGTTEIADTETDEDGFYIFSGLLLGTYAVKEELEPGYVNVTPILVGNLVITETNLDVENVNFTNQRLPPTGNISGYKLDPWGNGLADWEMKLSNETTELAETETDESGFYIFKNLSFDTYTVTEELKDDYLNITSLSHGNLVIDDDHQSIINVNFTNAPLTGTMTGWIASHCNVGQLSVPDARVRVALSASNLFSGPYWEVTTDSRGYYGIPKLPAGVTLYTTALTPANQPDTYTPAYYQVYPGKMLACGDQPCIVQITALADDELKQVNWIFRTNPYAFSMFF